MILEAKTRVTWGGAARIRAERRMSKTIASERDSCILKSEFHFSNLGTFAFGGWGGVLGEVIEDSGFCVLDAGVDISGIFL